MEIIRRVFLFFCCSALISCGVQINTSGSKDSASELRIEQKAGEKKIDVSFGEQLLTSYRYAGGDMKKTVLYPLNSLAGTEVTRPLAETNTPFERYDHPHHVGHWLNYGDVNGYDFWNHSTQTKADKLPSSGTIYHDSIDEVGNNFIVASATWKTPSGESLLKETTRFEFEVAKDGWFVDRTTDLTALVDSVKMTDNKEGMIAIRVRRSLEHPSENPVKINDSDGKPNPEPVMNNVDVTGMYTSSDGKMGGDVWGTRSKWVSLSGQVESVRFKYRIMIFSGPALAEDTVERYSSNFESQ